VQLQARPYGASTWSTITTVAAPWSEFEEQYSTTMTVKVRTAISASIVDRPLRRGTSPVGRRTGRRR
jgi:hypothetical protein